MSELQRYDIVVEHYDTGIGEDEVISLDYREGGDHASAYEALDIITVLKEQSETKEAALAAKDEEIRLLKACIFSCLQSDSYEFIKERMVLEEQRWEAHQCWRSSVCEGG